MQKSEPEIKAKALNRAFCYNPFSTKNAELLSAASAVRPTFWDVTVTPHLREKEAGPRQTSFQLRHVGAVGDLGDDFWRSEFRPVYATCFAYRRNVLDFHVRSLNFSFSPVGAALLCCRLLETALPAASWSQSGHAPTEGSHLGSIRIQLARCFRSFSVALCPSSRIRSRPSVRIHSHHLP